MERDRTFRGTGGEPELGMITPATSVDDELIDAAVVGSVELSVNHTLIGSVQPETECT